MYRFVICAQPFAGHVNPALPISQALVERGHDVRFYTGSRHKARVEATGARHVAPSRALDSGEDIDVMFPERAGLGRLDQARFDLTWFVESLPAQIADLEESLADAPADVVVCDQTVGCGYALHSKHGLPWATYGFTAIGIRDPLVPHFGLGIRTSTSRLAPLRNRTLDVVTRRVLFRFVQPAGVAALRVAGVEPDGRSVFDLPVSPYLYLQAGVPAMEYPRRTWPAQLHFVGALLPPPPPESVQQPSWWGDMHTAERVVLVTQGTVASDLEQLVVPTLRAFADDPATLVVATGPKCTAEALSSLLPLPANARVVPYLPFGPLMPHVDVMVTNGGYGGHLTALHAGVPLVVAPAFEEKPDVARRVAYAGVGIDMRTSTPTPRQVHTAVHQALNDPRYRATAAAVSADLRAAGGPALAADLLERLADTRDLVPRDPGAPLPALRR